MSAEDISNLYSRLLNKSIDSKTLSVWLGALRKGAITMDDVKKAIMTSEDYKSRVEALFKQQYFELVGFDGVVDALTSFMHYLEGSMDVADFESVGKYIKSTEQFKKKCIEMIETSYASIHGRNSLTQEITLKYLEKFTSSVYTLDDLVADLSSIAEAPPKYEHVVNDTVRETVDMYPTKGVHNFETTLKEWNPHQENILPPCKETVYIRQKLDESKLALFEKVFGRPMYVREYFKYVVDTEDPKAGFQDLEALKMKHEALYNQTRTLHRNYTGEDISEWEFVNKYLQIDDPDGFLDTFVNDLISSERYYKAMADMINTWNKKLYDAVLDSNDLAYLFNRVRQRKLHLYDDALVEAIKDFQTETELFVKNILQVYESVLGRQPEMHEFELYVDQYRNIDNTTRMNDVLANQLINSLEFHDVVKIKIKASYQDRYNKGIMNSKLYTCLDSVLKTIGPETLMADIDRAIENSLS